MLLSFDMLEDWEWNETNKAIQHVAYEIIRKNKQDVLVEFLSLTLKNNIFLQIVQRIQNFITVTIVSGLFNGKDIEKALRILDIFNLANE